MSVKRAAAPVAVVLAVAAGGALLVSAPAASAEGRLDIDWQAPASCPGERELRGNVENLLGAAPEAAIHGSMQVSGRVRPASDSAYQLTLRIESATEVGERSLEAASCAPLAEAAALLVAMAIDPSVRAQPAAPASAEAGPSLAPAPSAAPSARTPARRPRRAAVGAKRAATTDAEPDAVDSRAAAARAARARGVRSSIGLAGAVTLGDLPDPALGLRGSFGRAIGPYRLGLGLGYFGNQRVERAASAEPDARWGVSLWLFELDAQGCYQRQLAAFALGPCAGVGLRGFRASGRGADRVNSSFVVVPEAVLGGAVRYSLTPELGIFLNGAVRLVPVAPSFVVEGRGEVFQPAAFGASFDLGIEVGRTRG